MPKVSGSTIKTGKQIEMMKELERIRFELTESNVSVKFLQNFSGFSFEHINIPASSQGSQIEVPYFIAEILHESSMIEDFKSNFPISLPELEGSVRKEVRVGELQPLHPYFNVLLKDHFLAMEEKESQFSELEQKRQKTKFNQLIQERISKLVKMTDSRQVLAQRKRNLTSTEQILFDKIVDWIQNWKAEFIQE
ncbi:MAG: hypothetical protein JSW11_12255 [Candidatus Heimdallarchaeota archaeon]|nr:MAG: hypothetical protein JSW11_12255 [Candidatus Heimdallarchaeota archaeon]